MTWRIGLIWMAARLGRDLQAAARRAGGGERLWRAGPGVLARAFAGDDEVAGRFLTERRGFTPAAVQAAMTGVGGWWRPVDGSGGVGRLAGLPDPPFALIGCGVPLEEVIRPERPVVAIVGSRHPTADGLRFAEGLAADISDRGGVVVSGLALGIDAAAHRGAVAVGAPTIAVLGCGVGVDHPRTNSRLRRQLLDGGGTVASEYWPDTPPAPWRFPARNRIVAGVADAVVVVEAAERSGALITADFALELGRPVLAVPGRARAPLSAGCHGLLRAGAAFCETVEDVIAEVPDLRWETSATTASAELEGLDREIHELLTREPLGMDEVASRLDASAAEIAVAVGRLELAGAVVSTDGQRYWAASRRGGVS